MKYEEMLRMVEAKKTKNKPRNEEHRIQCECVKWFRLQYPKDALMLYAIPNGGRRDAITGSILKDEGVTKGVADLNLDIPNIHYHGLRIEIKTKKGTQSEAQKEFQRQVEARGYKYILCRSFDEFRREVGIYMSNI